MLLILLILESICLHSRYSIVDSRFWRRIEVFSFYYVFFSVLSLFSSFSVREYLALFMDRISYIQYSTLANFFGTWRWEENKRYLQIFGFTTHTKNPKQHSTLNSSHLSPLLYFFLSSCTLYSLPYANRKWQIDSRIESGK